MNIITCNELQKIFISNPDITILDVRTPAEFFNEHLPGSQNVPPGSIRGSRSIVVR